MKKHSNSCFGIFLILLLLFSKSFGMLLEHGVVPERSKGTVCKTVLSSVRIRSTPLYP